MDYKNTSSKGKEQGTDKKTKLSNTPFILLIILAFGLLGYQWFQYRLGLRKPMGYFA